MAKFPEWKLDAIAMMAIEPRPVDEIAAAIGCEVATVKRYLGGSNQKFNKILEGYQRSIINGAIYAQIKWHGMLDESFAVIQEALNQRKDLRLAVETGKFIIEQVVPTKSQKVEINHHFDGQVSAQVDATIHSVTATVNELTEFMRGGHDLNRHVLTGPEAFPAPKVELEASTNGAGTVPAVAKVKAKIEPTDDDSSHPDD